MLLTETAVNQTNAINYLHRNQNLKLTALSLLYDIIQRGGTATQSELSDYFPYTKQAMTLAVNFLEEEELVIRERDEKDRRIKHISITEKGIHTAQEALAIRRDFYAKMTEIVSPEEMDALIQTLQKLNQFFKRCIE